MRTNFFVTASILVLLLPVAIPAEASPSFQDLPEPLAPSALPAQSFTVAPNVVNPIVVRDAFTATTQAELDAIRAAEAAKVAAEAEKARKASLPQITPDPGSAQAIAHDQVIARGWGEDQFSCLVSLWNRESGWRVNAANASSGAYGIPQALPGNKMASAGADWQTNPATQITWGLNYISGRYSNPCGAWSHSENSGWY